MPDGALAGVVGVLTDIDDTLTRDGAIEPAALSALQRLHDAGLPVIAITGRPMGWSEPFARAWPVAAIVAENGAVALFREGNVRNDAIDCAGAAPALRIEYAQDEATRTRNALRLREVPGARLAQDSVGRVTDIAVDHSEFAHLGPEAIAQVVALMRAEGMVATVSSIHINGWFGEHDKRSGARWIVQRLLGRDVDAELERWVYVGDSTNDQLMFAHFPLSVGVANLMRFAAELTDWPTYIAPGERGLGFAQVAEKVLAAR